MSRAEGLYSNQRRVFRTAGIAASAAAILLTGCTAEPSTSQAKTVTVTPQPTVPDTAPTRSYQTSRSGSYVLAHLNYDGLTADGTCLPAGARPCPAPLRYTPNRSDTRWYNPGTFTTEGQYASITWPFERNPRTGRPADEFNVVCRVIGSTVYGVITDPQTGKVEPDYASASNVWDVVQVPAQKSRTNKVEYAYIPERWVYPKYQLVALQGTCSKTTNPAQAQVVPGAN